MNHCTELKCLHHRHKSTKRIFIAEKSNFAPIATQFKPVSVGDYDLPLFFLNHVITTAFEQLRFLLKINFFV